MKQYLVKKVYSCPKCGGKGEVEHPAWEAWKASHDEGIYTTKEIREWMQKQGWLDGCFWLTAEGLPDEIITCDKCDGNGVLEIWVNLEEALKEVQK